MNPIIAVEIAAVGTWLLLLTLFVAREARRLTFISIARYKEIEDQASVAWALVKHLGISRDELARLVHEEQAETRRHCPCDSCERWRKDHADHSDKIDKEEFKEQAP